MCVPPLTACAGKTATSSPIKVFYLRTINVFFNSPIDFKAKECSSRPPKEYIRKSGDKVVGGEEVVVA